MLMADVFGITLFHLGILAVVPGSWLLYAALCPAALDRGEARLRRMPLRAFFLGLGLALAAALAIVGLGKAGLQAPAGILGALAAGWALFGAAPLAKVVGSRLRTPGEPPWKSQARGGVVLLLPCMIPFLGWFLLFPLVLAVGLGAGTMAALRRVGAAPAVAAPLREPAELAA